jgi:hypothetical protein
MTSRRLSLWLFFSIILTLSACNLPRNQASTETSPNAVFTAAAQTVEAQLTQNALLAPATPVPPSPLPAATIAQTALPSETTLPLPQDTPAGTLVTPICDAAQFITDVTVPDGTQYSPGTPFTKTWRLKNIGACTWDASYTILFDTGDAMGGPASIPLSGTVAPGETVDLSVNLLAPAANNTYRGYWRLRNGAGVMLPVSGGYNSKSFYVEIKVSNGSGGSSETLFAVTSIGFNVSRSGTCASGKYVITATITVSKAGQVTYNWLYSDGGSGPSGSLDFSGAGSQSISVEWNTNLTGLWTDLYIDNPNHQQFGRATLNCP